MNPEWLSFHVFYAANSNPILVEGVTPVIRRLRAEGLIERWFFIRYWLEGPHVRLRVHPTVLLTVFGHTSGSAFE